ncbi:MAG TPA: hypothetical protein VGH52_03780 [Gaiellaceae bacterium]|jgi:hypothetical protein
MSSVAESIAAGARSESEVWSQALRTTSDWEPIFSPLAPPQFALGLETIYEAYLVHYGSPRLFEAPDLNDAVLLGDYLYAHGLVRIAEEGGVPAVEAMSRLISRCAALRAEGTVGDADAWLDAARDLGGAPTADAIERALALHSARVAP